MDGLKMYGKIKMQTDTPDKHRVYQPHFLLGAGWTSQMTKKVYKQKYFSFSVITKNSNWEILTKNLELSYFQKIKWG